MITTDKHRYKGINGIFWGGQRGLRAEDERSEGERARGVRGKIVEVDGSPRGGDLRGGNFGRLS